MIIVTGTFELFAAFHCLQQCDSYCSLSQQNYTIAVKICITLGETQKLKPEFQKMGKDKLCMRI